MKLLFLLLLTSCEVELKPVAPLYDTFRAIHAERYVPHVNDCSNKCGDYLRALDKAGIKAQIIRYNTVEGYHAVVLVNGHYFSPTSGRSMWDINPKSITDVLEIGDLDDPKWGDEFQ